MAEQLDLTVVIVSYNTKKLLKQCLESVRQELVESKIKAEVVVVDNGSVDGSVELVNKFKIQPANFKFFRLKNAVNVGFARASNQGAKKGKGRILLFLNSDAEVKDGAMGKMVAFMDRRPEVGVAGCRLENPDGSVQPQGGWLPRLTTVLVWAWFVDDIPGLGRFLPSYQHRGSRFSTGKPKRVGWLSGTAMWVRRKLWEELSGFDESLFMYGEDVDLCYRANRRGWQVVVNPQAGVVHQGRASDRGEAGWIKGEVAGLVAYFKEHQPSWEMPILRFILVVGMRLRWLIFGILGRDKKLKEAYEKAVVLARR